MFVTSVVLMALAKARLRQQPPSCLAATQAQRTVLLTCPRSSSNSKPGLLFMPRVGGGLQTPRA